ncbi:MAG TPA: hypothetical protein VHS80_15075, partial [Chthoniobacterales bacterium]|nr:hypothetical protein [Chthoniobacterales bacterium]
SVPAGESVSAANDATKYLMRLVSLERKIIKIQRTKLLKLRDAGEISDDTLRTIQSVLDLKESQLIQEGRFSEQQ